MQRRFANTYGHSDLCLFRKFACKECVVSYLVLLHLCQCFMEVTTPKLERVESLV